MGSIPGLVRSPGERNDNPFQYVCLGNPMNKMSLVGYSPRGHKRVRPDLATKQPFNFWTHLTMRLSVFFFFFFFLSGIPVCLSWRKTTLRDLHGTERKAGKGFSWPQLNTVLQSLENQGSIPYPPRPLSPSLDAECQLSTEVSGLQSQFPPGPLEGLPRTTLSNFFPFLETTACFPDF